MATAAELKARLAKYATSNPTPKQVQSSVRPTDQVGAGASYSGGSGAVPNPVSVTGMGITVVGKGTDTQQVVVSESQTVAQQGEINDTPKTQEATTQATQEHSVRTEGVLANDKEVPGIVPENSTSNADTGITVRTDVQSPDVVIVERPGELSSTAGTLAGKDEEHGQEGTGTDLDINNPVHQSFLQRLNDLEAALLARDPLMKTHLGEIHKAMIQYEEIANLLRPEEIAKIMAAQQQHTGMVLRAEVVGKSKASASKKAAGLGLNDV